MKNLVLWLCITTILIPGLSLGQSKPLEESIPAGTLAFLSFPNISEATKAFEKTSLSQLIQDQELREFVQTLIEPYEEQIKEGMKEIENEIGIAPCTLLKAFQGEVAIAVINVAPPTAVISIQYGEEKATIEKIISLFSERMHIEIETEGNLSNGSQIYKIDQGQTVYFAHLGDRIVFTTSTILLEDIAGGSVNSSLQSFPQFKTAKAKAQGGYTSAGFLYFNVKEIYRIFEKQFPRDVRKIVQDLGALDIHTISTGMNFYNEYVHTTFFVGIAPQTKGIGRLLACEPVSLDIARELPANASGLMAFHFDMGKFIKEAEKVVGSMPRGDKMLEQYQAVSEQVAQGLGFSIQSDIPAFLGNDHYLFRYSQYQETMIPYFIGIVSLKSPELFMKWMNTVCPQLSWDIKKMDYQGKELFYVSKKLGELGNNPFEQMERMSRKNQIGGLVWTLVSDLGSGTSFFIENNKVYWSPRMQCLKHYINRRGQMAKEGSLMDSPDFAKIKALVPQNTSFFWYADRRPCILFWWNTLVPIVGMFEGYMRAAGIPWDNAYVPMGENISRYFTPSLMTSSSDSDGFLWQSYSILPR